jgi:misacylated tRNA(Ala) deacylase
MTPRPTDRLYLADDPALEVDARIVAVRNGALALDRTCFYPGGGGQPPDQGWIRLADGSRIELASAHAEADGVIWHQASGSLPEGLVGQPARIEVDRTRREALARYHTVLHVLNTLCLRDYEGWITGAQIAVDYARIDFKLEGFSAAMRGDLESKVNALLAQQRPVRSRYLDAGTFAASHDLLRTLEVRPPVVDGRVRIVGIDGFDAQACGGTHVCNTAQIGAFRIERSENKGRINKRLYVRLEAPGSGP